MIRLLTYLALPSRALHWGNVAPGRNLPLTRSWDPEEAAIDAWFTARLAEIRAQRMGWPS